MTTVMGVIVELLFARYAIEILGMDVWENVGVRCCRDFLYRRFHAMSSLEMASIIGHIGVTHNTGAAEKIGIVGIREDSRRWRAQFDKRLQLHVMARSEVSTVVPVVWKRLVARAAMVIGVVDIRLNVGIGMRHGAQWSHLVHGHQMISKRVSIFKCLFAGAAVKVWIIHIRLNVLLRSGKHWL